MLLDNMVPPSLWSHGLIKALRLLMLSTKLYTTVTATSGRAGAEGAISHKVVGLGQRVPLVIKW